MKKIPAGILCLLFSILSCSFGDEYIRPLRIKVVDYETGSPLKGFNVHYELTENKWKLCLQNLLPLGGASHDFFYYNRNEITDENGELLVQKLCKKDNDNEYHEYIHINFDVNERIGFSLLNELQRKNKDYFGYYISNYDYCLENIKDWDDKAYEYIDVFVNGGSLKKKSESIVVKLKKCNNGHIKGTRFENNCVN
jgi:hypothetical protein